MKTNGNHEVIARIARQSLVLAALLATVLSTTSISRAQSSASSPAAPAAKAAAVPAKAPVLPAATPPAKGESEGVQIHGHWTIEVRNPDGSVAAHREFENALVPGGGKQLLANALGRALTPGSWRIALRQSASSGNGILEMDVDESGGPGAIVCAANNSGAIPTGCSTNLSVTPGSTLTLSGSDAVPQVFPATVGYVETDNYFCQPSVSPTACPTAVTGAANQFTFKNLDGVGTDPIAVPVSYPQTIAVTVVISFSSP